jgi:hypothetical protein
MNNGIYVPFVTQSENRFWIKGPSTTTITNTIIIIKPKLLKKKTTSCGVEFQDSPYMEESTNNDTPRSTSAPDMFHNLST